MKYVSGRIVRGIYIWLGLERGSGRVTSRLQTQPDINTMHNPATDILHSPAYEDGTDSEFRNVGN